MDSQALITAISILTLCLVTGMAVARAAGRQARPPAPGADDTAAGYLYVPCPRRRRDGNPVRARSRVLAVPITKKTPQWIYYTSDSWDRLEAVVSPGRISREEFETDTRCRHGYPAGVIPIPGDRQRTAPAGRLFFATRQAAEEHLRREEPQPAGQAAAQTAPDVALISQLRRAMADAHPDRGGTAEQFIQARRRYQTARCAA